MTVTRARGAARGAAALIALTRDGKDDFVLRHPSGEAFPMRLRTALSYAWGRNLGRSCGTTRDLPDILRI